jgi:plastocyanin
VSLRPVHFGKEDGMNRRQMATAMAIGGAALALGQRGAHEAVAGGWASLELVNPLQTAVVGVPVVIDAQILQHGIHPNPGFGGSILFTHEASGATETLQLEPLSRAHAIVRGEQRFSEAGAWRMSTVDMGPVIPLGTVEVLAPEEGEVISALRSPSAEAVACAGGETADGVETDILDMSFADPVLAVTVGTAVTWVNTSAVAHQVVFRDEAIGSSTLLREGDRFSAIFEEPGEFAYFCGPHPSMTGVVEVSEA